MEQGKEEVKEKREDKGDEVVLVHNVVQVRFHCMWGGAAPLKPLKL